MLNATQQISATRQLFSWTLVLRLRGGPRDRVSGCGLRVNMEPDAGEAEQQPHHVDAGEAIAVEVSGHKENNQLLKSIYEYTNNRTLKFKFKLMCAACKRMITLWSHSPDKNSINT